MKKIFAILIFASSCTKTPLISESVLISQIAGKSCHYRVEAESFVDYFKNSNSAKKDLCTEVSFWDRWTTRNFEERCLQSAIACLATIEDNTLATEEALTKVLLYGSNDIDTGDGLISIRGFAALSYALVAKEKATSALEKSLLRDDPAVKSKYGAFPKDYDFKSNTSHVFIQLALDRVRSIRKE